MEDLEMKLSEIRDYETKLSEKLEKSPFFSLLVGMVLWAIFIVDTPALSPTYFQGLCAIISGILAIWSISRGVSRVTNHISGAEVARVVKKAIDEDRLANGDKADSSGYRIIVVDATGKKLQEL
jgi:hypothetical protein